MVKISLIEKIVEQEQANQIRHEVFVIGQSVPESLEYDEFEKDSRHFLAFWDKTACGTARWRFTKRGIKLERFAVLDTFRGKGIGQALVKVILDDIYKHRDFNQQEIYLHAQITALNLYRKFGFKIVGDIFIEADIEHYEMILEK